jgi:DNA-binding MarR family transcriptional regulator
MADTLALPHRVGAVRRFNRYYTRVIGALQEGLLQSRFTLAEARVLYELAQHDDLTATDLGRELELDPGYLSRILQRFERDGMLAREPSPADRRQILLSLTAAGRDAFAPARRKIPRAGRCPAGQASGPRAGVTGHRDEPHRDLARWAEFGALAVAPAPAG